MSASSIAAAGELSEATEFQPGAVYQGSMSSLEDRCDRLHRLGTEQPRLPTTVNQESFVRCDIGDSRIGLSYSDGRLVLVHWQGADLDQAYGNRTQLAVEPVSYAGLDIYPDIALAVGGGGREAWILSPENLHAHLFLFTNPLMLDSGEVRPSRNTGDLLPAFVELEMTHEAVRSELSTNCPLHEERFIQPPTLPGVVDSQVQIDCFGLEVAGFPRKVEFVFVDGHLALIWILTGVGEQARLIDRLVYHYGAPQYQLGAYMVWPDGIALRTDVTEIMIAIPPIVEALIGR